MNGRPLFSPRIAPLNPTLPQEHEPLKTMIPVLQLHRTTSTPLEQEFRVPERVRENGGNQGTLLRLTDRQTVARIASARPIFSQLASTCSSPAMGSWLALPQPETDVSPSLQLW